MFLPTDSLRYFYRECKMETIMRHVWKVALNVYYYFKTEAHSSLDYMLKSYGEIHRLSVQYYYM